MQKSKTHFAKTTRFSFVNESYSFIGSLHERISFRGMNLHWEFEVYRLTFPEKTLTRSQRIERYEWVCLESDERPYHWNDEQWNKYLALQETMSSTVKPWFN